MRSHRPVRLIPAKDGGGERLLAAGCSVEIARTRLRNALSEAAPILHGIRGAKIDLLARKRCFALQPQRGFFHAKVVLLGEVTVRTIAADVVASALVEQRAPVRARELVLLEQLGRVLDGPIGIAVPQPALGTGQRH